MYPPWVGKPAPDGEFGGSAFVASRFTRWRNISQPPRGALVLEGLYEYEMPLWPASLEKSGQGAFRVLLGQNAWIMSYENRAGAKSGRRVHETGITASCDGGNIYVIRHPEPRRLPTETVSRMADIYPGNIPPPVKQDLYNIWLAIVSPQVLTNDHGTTRPLMRRT